jgi:radical SAM superfamily enzyme YgiQ (UPF0313 family)
VSDHSTRSGRIRVGLVQINNSFAGQNYFPYSVGLLQAYAQQHLKAPDRCEFSPPIYTRIPVKDAVAHLQGHDVVGFSTYVWNVQLSLAIARELKRLSPETLIVFGGPQVPDQPEGFLREHRCIDVACHGEGEVVFTAILDHLPDRTLAEVPSISYLNADGRLVTHPRAPRLTDLSTVPSPYLTGVFDPLAAANPRQEWIAMWETNRGCPFSCTFCDWGSAVAAKVYRFDLDRLLQEIDWFVSRRLEFVFCCDANFGILPRDEELAQHIVKVKQTTGYPKALSVQNTKNATERAYRIQKLLAEFGLNKGVTVSLQSTDPTTLKLIRRDNISSDSFRELQRRFTKDRVETYSDLILGLPGETYDSFVTGVSDVIANGQHNRIQFNNLSILPNAEMGNPEYQARYGMVSVQSKIINVHGSSVDEEIYETQDLVVATHAMPADEWVRTRAFCWMTSLLHFDKVLQVPLVLLQQATGLTYREMIESFSEGALDDCPVLSRVRTFFRDKAREIQAGGPEYCLSTRWLSIWWPPDEYILIELAVDGQLEAFYREAERVLGRLLDARRLDLPRALLSESVELNRRLLKRPFETEDDLLPLSYNLWDAYQAACAGDAVPIEARATTCRIDRTTGRWSSWDDWCQQVVWYGNKKGAYLYANHVVESQLPGHY